VEKRGGALAVVGGGSGLAVVLRGLKSLVGRGEIESLTGVVTVTDDGGSSGRLRRDFGVLPPGDIRNCIVALADDEDLLTRLFQYRFPSGEGLSGHSFGNLFLTALTGITGDFYQAILTAESILSVRGKILPSTLTDVRLEARGASGRTYRGESAVGTSGETLASLTLDPPCPAACGPATRALEEADLILLGPGSLFTSILPNLLIPGIQQAIRRGRGTVALVVNLMTQPGETDAMSALDHLDALERHAGAGLVDAVVAHEGPLPPRRLRQYAAVGSQPVPVDRQAIQDRGLHLVAADLLAPGSFLHHDPRKLAAAVLPLMGNRPGNEAKEGAGIRGLRGLG
jgi:uncharacterized cofD-like protein